MVNDSPAVIVFGTDGYEVSVRDNVIIQNNTDIRGLLIAGSDGYKSHHIRTNSTGALITSANIELATFNAIATNIQTNQNKSLFSITNTSTKTIRIEEIYLINVRVQNANGVQGIFEIRRINGHSGGTIVSNIEAYETSDILDPGITVLTGSTVSGESSNILWRNLFSTDENSIGIESPTNTEHIFQTMFPIFMKKTNNAKTITLNNNEGLTIKFTTNSITGLFDIFCIFTQQ